MSFQQAYNKSANRNVEFISKDEVELDLRKEEIRKWLQHPISRELILFLGKRELELLNNARILVRIDIKSDNITKNLLKAVGYREVIEYLTQNKQPEIE